MFPKWMYHATKGARLFKDPEALDEAGAGWRESPADVGIVPEVPTVPGGMLHVAAPQQPEDDESVATADEAAASAARAAKNAHRAKVPTTPASRAFTGRK